MRRISNEEGREASARNIGRLALSMIPAALGGAAVLWVLAASGWVDLSKSYRAERRVLSSVGLQSVPFDPIVFETHDARCLKVDAASMRDGDHVVFYVKNTCTEWLKVPNYGYRVQSGDAVVDSGRFAYGGDKNIGPAERREQVIWLEHGISRVTRIRIDAFD